MLSQIDFSTGALCDVQTIAEQVHHNGSLLLVDGSQAVGAVETDVKKLNIDVLITTGTKYLCAPPGIAFLYVEESLSQRLQPTVGGWFGHRYLFTHLEEKADAIHVHPDERIFSTFEYYPAQGTRRFEQGTPEVMAATGAIPAVALLIQTGLGEITRHVRRLGSELIAGITELGGHLETPLAPARRGPVVVLKTPSSGALGAKLLEHRIITSPRGNDGLRFAMHLYNNSDDITRTLDALSGNRSLFLS